MKPITDAEFLLVQDEVERRLRATTLGTPERAEVEHFIELFEQQLVKACNARGAKDRQEVNSALRALAVQYGYIKLTHSMKPITDTEFDLAQQEMDRRLRATKPGTPERAAFEKFMELWDFLVTHKDREEADILLRQFAIDHELIKE